MSDKSFVSMEQHQCFVCGATYDTGALLLDKRMRNSMKKHTLTGTGLCPEHQKLKDDGFVALIEADEATHTRLGRIAHLRAEVWPNIFNVPVPDKMVAFAPPEVLDMLERAEKQAE